MADDRTDIPGSGDVEPDDRNGGAPPPSPQAASHQPEGSTASEDTATAWGPICLIGGILGCGCLIVVLLAFGLIGGIGWTLFEAPGESDSPLNAAPATPDIEMMEPEIPPPVNPAPGPAGEQPVGDEAVDDPAAASGPGRDAALAWAENRRPDWDARVNDHSDDWHWVRLIMGPPGSPGTTWVEIEWNTPAGRYGLLDEGPIASDEYEEEPVSEDIPDIYQPGEEVAKEAALGYIEQPNWIARVDSHSPDWRRATVSVGPPASEFVYVVTLQWDDELDVYDQISIDDVDYPGME